MALEPPSYLASLQSNIRSRPIAWDGAVRSDHLTKEQLAKIRAVDGAKKERRVQTVENDLDGYRILFVGELGKPSVLEKAEKRQEVVQYILVLLNDLLNSVPSLSKVLYKHGNPYKKFLSLLSKHTLNPEDPILLLTSTVLVTLMAASRDESPATIDQAVPIVFSYLTSLAKNTDPGLQDIGVQHYSSLLYGHASRLQFWKQRSETVASLVSILRSAAGASNGDSLFLGTGNGGTITSPMLRHSGAVEGAMNVGIGLQLLYHVLLVMWQLSFDSEDVGEDLDEKFDIVLLYTQLLRLSPKEKTTRLIVSTLLNLLTWNRTTLMPTAVLVRLPSLLQNVSSRPLTDTDLQQDLTNLREMLDEYTKTKTTFDEYVAEVQSGHLRWSPPHRNNVFWAENANRILEYENGELVRKLAEIMKKPWDNDRQVLAIACNDVGALVREVPEKRCHLETLGLKTRVMELMGDADGTIRWESLRALGGWLKYRFESK